MVVQALGIASSFAVLTQIRAAGFMPRSVYAALAVVVGLQVRLLCLLPDVPAVPAARCCACCAAATMAVPG